MIFLAHIFPGQHIALTHLKKITRAYLFQIALDVVIIYTYLLKLVKKRLKTIMSFRLSVYSL